jgi:hypothetical protein
MFYLTYVMVLLAGTVIGADSWGVARPGAALDSSVAHGRRVEGSRGGVLCGVGGSRGGGQVV